ncbi:MAG: 3-deoxy-D-manno-octulosonic acid transferase [Bacteroidetes bacterium]|nr:3-deoxy-D-manno-octulosonic acid transferase [Bacteroidota bacterium]
MQTLYNLIIKLYGIAIFCASVNKPKAKQWVNGRKDWRKKLSDNVNKLPHSKTIWVHCASYGEFEQGAPLIEAIKNQKRGYNMVVTFFSPSGYMAFNKTPLADGVFYLPLDTPTNAREFIDVLKPGIAIFVKYEFWLNYLKELRFRNIPAYLVSATFKPHHPFFKWYGSIFIDSLFTFKTIYLQDIQSQKLLKKINIHHTKITGDTRFDRVYQNKLTEYEDRIIHNFKGNQYLFIAGSTWPNDDDYILETLKQTQNIGFRYVIAPHEVNDSNLAKLYEKLNRAGFQFTTYTNFQEGAQILVVNCMGVLSKIYKYADFSYVGGGFNTNGIHNMLEPTVFGKPSSFYGKNYTKFNEIIELKAISCILNLNENLTLTNVLNNYAKLNLVDIENKLSEYFKARIGSTEVVVKDIFAIIKSE